MGWFSEDDRDREQRFERERRKHDRQQQDARAQRLATLHKALAQAVTEALATDAVVQQVVWELAQLDVKADVTTVVEMTYEPLLSRRTGPAASTQEAEGAVAVDSSLGVADRAWLMRMGISTGQ